MQLSLDFDHVYGHDYVAPFQYRVDFYRLHNPGVLESWDGDYGELWKLIHNYWYDHAVL